MKKLIKIFLICTLVLLALSVTVSAETEGYYTYTVSNDEATITDVNTSISGDITIPSTLGGYLVTTIGPCAFEDCADLTSVEIGDSVTTIGNYAFCYCSSLTSVVIPDSVTTIGFGAFSDCTGLTSVVIPDSVTTIGGCAFIRCTGLTSIVIPDSVTTIGDGVFSSCDGLTSIAVNENNKNYCSVDGNLFNKEKTTLIQYAIGRKDSVYVIPNSVTTIGFGAFSGCTGLTSVVIPDSVTTIGGSAFSRCTGLTSIVIPDSVTTIGNSAFHGCTGLTAVYISDLSAWCNIKFGNSGSNPLYYAKNLYVNNELVTNLVIPADLTTIGQYAFYNCTSLTSVEISDSISSIGQYAFFDCTGLTSVEIPDSVTTIGLFAFDNCENIEEVYICDIETWLNIIFESYASNPLAFGGELYLNNELLTELIIPNTITKINNYAFINCKGLSNIVFSNSVTSVGRQAFYGCTNLVSIVIQTSITSIDSYAFYGKDITVYYEGSRLQWSDIMLGDDDPFSSKTQYVYNSRCVTVMDAYNNKIYEEWLSYGTTLSENIEYKIKDKYKATFYTDKECTKLFDMSTEITEDTVLYCTLKDAYCTYKFLNGDGSVMLEKTVDYGATLNETPTTAPTKAATQQYTYTFSNWDGYSAGMTLTKDMTFTPVFNSTVNKYTYKFLNEDGSVHFERTANYGTKIELPSEPTKASTSQYNYTFSEWIGYTEGMKVTENVTFTPEFTSTVNKYIYKFVDEDGNVIEEKTAEYGTMIELPKTTPVKTATAQYTYIFDRWIGYVQNMPLTKDVVFTAEYKAIINQYTYKFLDDNGSEIYKKTADYGALIEVPTSPVKESTQQYTYTFSKWNGYTDGMLLTGDITFTPEFTSIVNKYTYKFLNEDGNTYFQETAEYGSVIELPENPVKEATAQHTYTFSKWNGYTDGMILTGDVTFTPEFISTINKYTYKFLYEGGNTYIEETAEYGSVIKLPENPVKEATAQYTYTFSKWKGYTDGMILTGDITFTAEFVSTINKYTYRFLNEDESVFYENTVEYGTEIAAPDKVPTKAGPYIFDKWEGYNEGMEITEDVSFKAIFKYMDFDITLYNDEGMYAETVVVTFNDEYVLPIKEIQDYEFIAYYTEKNGKGTKLTDENGKSIEIFTYKENISAYPHYVSIYNEKLNISEKSAEVGTKNVAFAVDFATLNEAEYLTFTLKYPETLLFNKIQAKEFEIVTNNEPEIIDGYAFLSIAGKFTQNGIIPTNKKINPFDIVFDISEDIKPQDIELIVENAIMLSSKNQYKFNSINNGKLTIRPKLAEKIEIIGECVIDGTTKYTAVVSPCYTTNKEVVWSVDKETVAIVSEDGILTPVTNGEVELKATAKDGSLVYATKTISVTAYAKIEDLSSNVGKLNFEFEPQRKVYTLYIPEETEKIGLTARFEGTTMVNGTELMIPGYQKLLSVSEKETRFTLTAKGIEGQTTDAIYTINVIKVPEEAEFTINNTETDTVIELSLPVEMLAKEKVYMAVKSRGKNSKQVNIAGKMINNDTNKVSITIPKSEETEKYVVFFWESLANLKPVYEPIEKEL